MKISDMGKTTWIDRFGTAYKAKWKSLGKSQRQFAEAVNKVRTREERGTIGTVTSQQVSKWLHGSIPEEENLKAICEVLELEIEYFLPTDVEQYQDSSRYVTKIGKEHTEFAEEIGLDLNLVKAIHNLTDWNNDFPQYAPMDEKRVDRANIHNMFAGVKRIDSHYTSAPIDPSLDFLQIEKDGQLRTLHKADLAYLKDVQDQVIEYVNYLFYKRREAMKREVEQVNSVLIKPLEGGGTTIRYNWKLKWETIMKVDPYSQYAYQMEEKPDDKKE